MSNNKFNKKDLKIIKDGLELEIDIVNSNISEHDYYIKHPNEIEEEYNDWNTNFDRDKAIKDLDYKRLLLKKVNRLIKYFI